MIVFFLICFVGANLGYTCWSSLLSVAGINAYYIFLKLFLHWVNCDICNTDLRS